MDSEQPQKSPTVRVRILNAIRRKKSIGPIAESSLPWRYFRNLGLVLVLCIVLFILANWAYFDAEIRFAFFHPPTQTPGSELVNANMATMQPDHLSIPSLGLELPIVYTDKTTEADFQEALKSGVVHFPGTALPGQLGNVYIFGHSSDYLWSTGKFKTAFALLPKIQNGAEIDISDNVGRSFKYFVFNQFVTAPSDTSVLSQGGNKRRFLTLQTSYPVGTALKRYIVQAELQ